MDEPVSPADYYGSTHFPSDVVHQLLSLHSQSGRAERTEVAAEYDPAVTSYKFRRYNSCPTPEALRKLATSRGIVALHLGATFDDVATRARNNAARVTSVGKPLVFDMDIQDIPIIQREKCDFAANDRWTNAVIGVARVLKAALEQAFGYKHFLCVYSGRRGCHLWVLDEGAFHLTDGARRAITEMISGTVDKQDARLLVPYPNIVHNPSFEAALQMHHRIWYDTMLRPRGMGGVGVLDTYADIVKFVDILFTPNTSSRDLKPKTVDKLRTLNARERDNVCATLAGKFGEEAFHLVERAVWNNPFMSERLKIMKFTYCWPCIDVDASSKRDHLTKVPFSMHGVSRRLAVPVELDVRRGGDPPRVPILKANKLLQHDEKAVTDLAAYVEMAHAALTRACVQRHAVGVDDVDTTHMDDIEDLVAAPAKRCRVGGPVNE
jgi:hypothetical protein